MNAIELAEFKKNLRQVIGRIGSDVGELTQLVESLSENPGGPIELPSRLAATQTPFQDANNVLETGFYVSDMGGPSLNIPADHYAGYLLVSNAEYEMRGTPVRAIFQTFVDGGGIQTRSSLGFGGAVGAWSPWRGVGMDAEGVIKAIRDAGTPSISIDGTAYPLASVGGYPSLNDYLSAISGVASTPEAEAWLAEHKVDYAESDIFGVLQGLTNALEINFDHRLNISFFLQNLYEKLQTSAVTWAGAIDFTRPEYASFAKGASLSFNRKGSDVYYSGAFSTQDSSIPLLGVGSVLPDNAVDIPYYEIQSGEVRILRANFVNMIRVGGGPIGQASINGYWTSNAAVETPLE